MTKEGLVEEIHKPVRKNFPRRRVVLKGLADLWQADLIEMIPYSSVNNGYKYILTVINAFSKYVYLEPLRNKTGKDVTIAMQKILSTASVKPRNLQTDNGSEFYNRQFQELMQKYKIRLYSVYTTKKACIVERVIRTLKSKLWKIFSLQGNYKWSDKLEVVSKDYNSTVHSSIGIEPVKVKSQNEAVILHRLQGHVPPILSKPKFKKGDPVRISKVKSMFEKGFTPNWSAEVFNIQKVQRTKPLTYLLQDFEGNPIKGCFYPEELQKTQWKDEYLVEKVLRRKQGKAYVKWWGFDNSHNSWINTTDLL